MNELVQRAQRLGAALAIWRNADQPNATSYERSAAHEAMHELDWLLRELQEHRQALTAEIRHSDDAAMERTTDLLESYRKRVQA